MIMLDLELRRLWGRTHVFSVRPSYPTRKYRERDTRRVVGGTRWSRQSLSVREPNSDPDQNPWMFSGSYLHLGPASWTSPDYSLMKDFNHLWRSCRYLQLTIQLTGAYFTHNLVQRESNPEHSNPFQTTLSPENLLILAWSIMILLYFK